MFKKVILLNIVLFFLSVSQAYGSFYNEHSHETMSGYLSDNDSVCMVLETHDHNRSLLTDFSINKSILRRAFRSLTYAQRAQIDAESAVAAFTVATGASEFTGGLSFLALPFIWGYQSIKKTTETSKNSSFVHDFFPYVGERMLRGKRLDQVLSPQNHKMSNKIYERIKTNIAELTTTDSACDIHLN